MAFRKRTKAINVKNIEQIDEFTADGKPVLIDFMQSSSPPCRAMDGTIDELAHEFRESAHVLKVNVGKVPGAAQHYKIKGTPTFVLFGTSERSQRKAKQRGEEDAKKITQRFRTTGIVKKEQLRRLLTTNGAEAADS
ncbi:thioredoxin-1 [bacterium BMS3Abin02]|nr:thioredoxin-1 [bacterium BMS3Abin02]GBE21641.1 thioredoxin-1 [bacterium BMS3Bbin01]HDH26732.1 thioredoxin [Actinomycetota bacterium]HDK45224.1 thioredoxin [Actinomycetota bacterium]HDL50219.1 thioredoxin [Actinomycetota bacterium]